MLFVDFPVAAHQT